MEITKKQNFKTFKNWYDLKILKLNLAKKEKNKMINKLLQFQIFGINAILLKHLIQGYNFILVFIIAIIINLLLFITYRLNNSKF